MQGLKLVVTRVEIKVVRPPKEGGYSFLADEGSYSQWAKSWSQLKKTPAKPLPSRKIPWKITFNISPNLVPIQAELSYDHFRDLLKLKTSDASFQAFFIELNDPSEYTTFLVPELREFLQKNLAISLFEKSPDLFFYIFDCLNGMQLLSEDQSDYISNAFFPDWAKGWINDQGLFDKTFVEFNYYLVFELFHRGLLKFARFDLGDVIEVKIQPSSFKRKQELITQFKEFLNEKVVACMCEDFNQDVYESVLKAIPEKLRIWFESVKCEEEF